ncbi:MAG: hypothetical protein KTR14_10885 [Vampirovibrio sp.]|nr:hypothetical protein [Vampirovibrio sp.]
MRLFPLFVSVMLLALMVPVTYAQVGIPPQANPGVVNQAEFNRFRMRGYSPWAMRPITEADLTKPKTEDLIQFVDTDVAGKVIKKKPERKPQP